MEYGILTTRFTNETFEENQRWRASNQHSGCIYMLTNRISNALDFNKLYFVIEMNNSINKIMGIGLISIRHGARREKIYRNIYYNRYMYKGAVRIETYANGAYLVDQPALFTELFEDPLFRGKGHRKRGSSMSHFPYKKITPRHLDYLKSLLEN
jgi:hypothetical protein